ncbi:hypothetical protein NDU88_003527 [Pleurodeles waltl]|uniref:Uncharacterized protein n=1 Tax=Pleurodeles waltl TaxID=8319 RepID=A0AAV7L459_PLEWA|nr:hypothetical protein NDU88_003527 [Pleurodeles waltl]
MVWCLIWDFSQYYMKLVSRDKEEEDALGQLTPDIGMMDTQLRDLTTVVARLQERTENSEGSSLLHNIRITGLPEKMEGQLVELFMEQWLIMNIYNSSTLTMFSVERRIAFQDAFWHQGPHQDRWLQDC